MVPLDLRIAGSRELCLVVAGGPRDGEVVMGERPAPRYKKLVIGPRAGRMCCWRCSRCGALVLKFEDRAGHTEWHAWGEKLRPA